MASKTVRVEYRFRFPDGRSQAFPLTYDADRVELVEPAHEAPPAWTDLAFHQCPNCPLSTATHRTCPLAVSLSHVVAFFSRVVSYEEVDVEVHTEERTYVRRTTAQAALCSLLGLLQATSRCPRMAFFKPMARFHLPFSSPEDTLFRVASTYLLAQFFRHRDGEAVDFALEGLAGHYRQIEQVNRAVASRLLAASEADASVNAVVLLDLFAKMLPEAVEEALDELRPLFASYLMQGGRPVPATPPVAPV